MDDEFNMPQEQIWYDIWHQLQDSLLAFCFILLLFFITFLLSRWIELIYVGSVFAIQKLSTQSNAGGEVIGVELVGRAEGLLAFFLTVAGISPVTTLVVNSREVVCKRAGLLQVSHKSFPVNRVCEVTTGSRIPVEYFVVGAIVGVQCLVVCLASLLSLRILAAPLFLIMAPISYYSGLLLLRLNKRFYLRVFSPSGRSISLAFSSNMIEGVRLDFDRMTKISSVIRKIVAASCP